MYYGIDVLFTQPPEGDQAACAHTTRVPVSPFQEVPATIDGVSEGVGTGGGGGERGPGGGRVAQWPTLRGGSTGPRAASSRCHAQHRHAAGASLAASHAARGLEGLTLDRGGCGRALLCRVCPWNIGQVSKKYKASLSVRWTWCSAPGAPWRESELTDFPLELTGFFPHQLQSYIWRVRT